MQTKASLRYMKSHVLYLSQSISILIFVNPSKHMVYVFVWASFRASCCHTTVDDETWLRAVSSDEFKVIMSNQ